MENDNSAFQLQPRVAVRDAVMEPASVGFDGCCLGDKPTGVANYVAALLAPLCRLHPNVTFHLYSNYEGVFPEIANLVSHVSVGRRRGPVWQNTRLAEMIRRDDIDVFWGTNGLIPLRNLGRTATVLTVHDLVHRFMPDTQKLAIRWKQRLFQPWCARASDCLIAVSQATATDIEKVYRRRPDMVIHPLANERIQRMAAETAWKTAHELHLPSRYILTVGTLEPRKNLVALIKAHANCLQRGLALPPLVLAGAQGWLNDELRALVEATSKTGAVRYLGYVPDETLAHLYSCCTVFVMPSRYEGFGMPLLESQLCGAAVVHGDHPSMVEAAGRLGVAIEPTEEALSTMLGQLAAGELALACRLPSDIENDAEASANRLWLAMIQAMRVRRARTTFRLARQ